MKKFNLSPFPILSTPRLILRQLQDTDSAALYALRSTPEVNQYLERKPPASIQDIEAFISARNKEIEKNINIIWAITHKKTKQCVGTICIWNFSEDGSSGELGYELGLAYQKQGFMSEALRAALVYGQEDLGLNQMTAYTREDNLASRDLLERHGFMLQKYVLESGAQKCQAAYVLDKK